VERCSTISIGASEAVARACQGDLDAYDELVTQYRAMAVRIAQSFVRDRELAEDVAQESFVRAFLSIRKLRSPEAFKSYLTRTIVRSAIDYRRKSYTGEVVMEIAPKPSADSTLNEETIYIHYVLDHLSAKLREVIILRDLAGMDYESIAEALKLPVGTVRSRLSAARSAFKTMYLNGFTDEMEV